MLQKRIEANSCHVIRNALRTPKTETGKTHEQPDCQRPYLMKLDSSPEGGLISWMRRVCKHSGFSVGFAHVTHRMRSPETHAFNSTSTRSRTARPSSTHIFGFKRLLIPFCVVNPGYNLVFREPVLQIKNTDKDACTVFPIGNEALLI